PSSHGQPPQPEQGDLGCRDEVDSTRPSIHVHSHSALRSLAPVSRLVEGSDTTNGPRTGEASFHIEEYTNFEGCGNEKGPPTMTRPALTADTAPGPPCGISYLPR
ncbi:hypothetical protein J6590_011239, partial [Homalodisca vitripennis]